MGTPHSTGKEWFNTLNKKVPKNGAVTAAIHSHPPDYGRGFSDADLKNAEGRHMSFYVAVMSTEKTSVTLRSSLITRRGFAQGVVKKEMPFRTLSQSRK